MLWTTKPRIRISRAATCWLIRRFVDPAAEFRFVPDDEALCLQHEQGAIAFHVPGGRYPPLSAAGQLPFEALVREHQPDDAALVRMAHIVNDADRPPKDRAEV